MGTKGPGYEMIVTGYEITKSLVRNEQNSTKLPVIMCMGIRSLRAMAITYSVVHTPQLIFDDLEVNIHAAVLLAFDY